MTPPRSNPTQSGVIGMATEGTPAWWHDEALWWSEKVSGRKVLTPAMTTSWTVARGGQNWALKVARQWLSKHKQVPAIGDTPRPIGGRVQRTSRWWSWWSYWQQHQQLCPARISAEHRQCLAATTKIGGPSGQARVPSSRVNDGDLNGGNKASD